MRNLIPVLLALSLAACGGRALTDAEAEERRRGELDLQSVLDMVTTRQVKPIEFEFNSDVLLPSSLDLLDRVASVLRGRPRLKLIVEGHTDDVGDDDYNMELSRYRADAVKSYLVKKGIHPETILSRGYGETRPISPGKTEKDRALNRRVEFKITTRDWGTVF
ncbi:MAG: peptidoglycan-associated lipoprotein [Elusimicrobia bacterium]|nr:MAG: peptidoglycan-associated lipoprotein [Elusimicrobiota bacterium]KAF0154846.1 MAG: peptidoglycan-associated lipoprotein [Elusimicrobiota bacterium]